MLHRTNLDTGAMTMNSAREGIEMMNDLGNKGYVAAQSLGEIHLRAIERLVGRQLDAIGLLLESGLRQAKMIAEVKGPADLMKGQIELAREVGERMLAEGRENMRLIGDTREEYRHWLEQGAQTVGEGLGQRRPAA
jgi:phasin family protein